MYASRVRQRLGRLLAQGSSLDTAPDLTVTFGRLTLPNPIMPASGTYGYGTEFAAYGDPSLLGAVVVKSLSAAPWKGNAAPRLVPLRQAGSMLNAVGLPNPGVRAWAETHLPDLLRAGARVVASLWGHTREEFLACADALSQIEGPVAWEVNLSCPNLDRSNELFAHNALSTRSVMTEIRELAGADRVIWAKLSPSVPDIVEIAQAAAEGTADAVTIANSYPGLAIDPETGRYRLGNVVGGVSGAGVHEWIVRLVCQVHLCLPDLPVVAAGGASRGEDAAEFLVAGASAVQVGTANFYDPRATHKVLTELEAWCRKHRKSPQEMIGTVALTPAEKQAIIEGW